MHRIDRLVWIASITLIALGILSLALNLVLGWTLNLSWPFVTIMLGVVFYVLVNAFSAKWRWAGLLYLPGSLLIALGVIFLINIVTGDWNAWAYAWLLAVAGLGLGIVLANRELHWRREASLVGAGLMVGGVTLSVLFGAIAGGKFIMVMAPILLVLGGLALRWLHIETLLPERILRRFRPAVTSPTGAPGRPDQSPLVEPLSTRELEVLQLIEQGLSNQEIADKLTLAPSTVKTHINNIYGKLGVQTRVQAIKQARELGLLISNPR